MYIRITIVLFLLCPRLILNAQVNQVDHWETLILHDQEWAYFVGTEQPPPGWYNSGFDDSSWLSGKGGFGYGDSDDSTILDPALSVYMRKVFTLNDLSAIAFLVLYMDYDDAFVAYLNGQEIARSNIGVPGVEPAYNDSSAYFHEARMYRGLLPEEFRIPVSWLAWLIQTGENVLALQVHNARSTSSDLSAIPNLFVGINDSSFTYSDLPDWFEPPIDYTTSEIPIVSINTLGQSIQDEERIRAQMGVIDNGPGNSNQLNDPITDYNGWINIEYRGESATGFPKKSYGFETQDELGENNNVSLLDLPTENDWILYGPYSDKSLIRNVLTYQLSNELGRYASRTRFCDLFINDYYQGLYILQEKIKRDKNRVDIANLLPADILGDQLTGGYILRVDKVDADDYPPWTSYPSPSLPGASEISFQYFDPDGWELTSEQQNYIKDYILRFESALSSNDFKDPVRGYKPFINVPSFVDYLILTELNKNVDGYLFSTYMFKDRDSKNGKLNMGPVWDYNLAFGNVDYWDNALNTTGWLFEDDYRMYWFRRMMEDPDFINQLSCRWHSLRAGLLSNERILGLIDSMGSVLEVPAERNFRQWPIIGEYIWPNYFIGSTYVEELIYVKNWISDRLVWLDENISETCINGIREREVFASDIKISPNPSEVLFYIKKGALDQIITKVEILNVQGRRLFEKEMLYNNDWVVYWDEAGSINNGIYLIRIQLNDGNILTRKIIRK